MFAPSLSEWLLFLLISLGVIWASQRTGVNLFLSSLCVSLAIACTIFLFNLGKGLGYSLAMALSLFVVLWVLLSISSHALFGIRQLLRRLRQNS